MKQLQNNFTTPKQSKRLLELGVPADSADCYYNSGRYANTPTVIGDKTGRQYEMICGKLIPCWSAGRLIEIYNMCANNMPGMQLDLGNDPENCTYIELIVSSFELAADDGLLDFSKLED